MNDGIMTNEPKPGMGDICPLRGEIVEEWLTGDNECDASSYRYECGGIYHHNYMDIVGCRDHDCFWDCRNCKYKEE